MEAIGTTTATITQTSAIAAAIAATIARASANVGQEGPSNLQRFKAHYPSNFKGGGEPMEANRWF